MFVNGKPFRVVEGSELHEFVRSSQLFRKVPSSEYQVSGRGEVLLVDNPEAPRIPVAAAPDHQPLQEDEIRGPSNSSWSDIEAAESPKLMRHASHNGKRGGNSP